jgi:hypothetical protein
LHIFNVDINYVVTSLALIWLVTRIVYAPWSSLMHFVERYWMSSITINESEYLLWRIQKTYLSKHEDKINVRYLNASRKGWKWNTTEPGTVDEDGWLKFTYREANRDFVFTPSKGTHRARLNSRIFYLPSVEPKQIFGEAQKSPSLKISC